MFTFGVTMQMIPPVLGMLVNDLGMTHAQAGALMGLFTLPGIFLAIPGGRLSDRFGPRVTGIISLAFLCAGSLLMTPLTIPFLYLGRILAGIGGSVIVVVAPQVIAHNFPGRELGRAMGIFSTAVPLGTIVAFNILGYTGKTWGITPVFASTGALGLVALIMYSVTIGQSAASHDESGHTHSHDRASIWKLGRNIWLVSLVWMLFNVGILSFFTFGIDYFAMCGFGPKMANFMGSLPMLLSIPLVPVCGLLIDRYGWRSGPLITGNIICGSAILLIAFDPLRAVAWTVLLGLGISVIPPVIFTMAGEVVSRENAGLGFGLLTAVFNAGIFLGIPLAGLAKDITGNYSASFILIAAVTFTGSVVALGLRKVRAGGIIA